MTPIGVLLFENAGDRITGDPGAPETFPFPIRYGVVPGSYRDLIQGSPGACARLCRAARELEAAGVSAIAGDCGLMALYQEELSRQVKVPVISSSLVLLPLLRAVLGTKKIGILTGHSQLLSHRHLEAAGAGDDGQIAVMGMEDQPHFCQVVLEGTCPQDYRLMARDVLNAVAALVEREGELGAIVLECSNLTTFAREITRCYGIPVFDVNLAIRMLEMARNPVSYQKENQ